MAAITASMVKELRGKTDAPMMECKKALTEADGNMEKAEELLRVKLGNKAGKAAAPHRRRRRGRPSHQRRRHRRLVEVNCETDFVAKNDDFLAFAKALAELVAKPEPGRRRRAVRAALQQDGFGPTLEDVRKGLVGKIGENMSLRRFKRLAGQRQARQLHARHASIGVLVDVRRRRGARARTSRCTSRRCKPVVADAARRAGRADRQGARASRADEGRTRSPASRQPRSWPRCVEGARAEIPQGSHPARPAVRQGRQADRRADAQDRKTRTVHGFTLYVVGEGIEKKVDDFAAEVAAQVDAG